MRECLVLPRELSKSNWDCTSSEETMCMFHLLITSCSNSIITISCCNFRVLIGEIDNELDSRLNLSEIRAEPLAQIHH